jgi:hypothetical protein
MKLIKLTSFNDGKPIYVNVDQIGHMYEVPAKKRYGKVEEEAHTTVGVMTHNNGGFKVVEDISKILKLIGKYYKVGSLD